LLDSVVIKLEGGSDYDLGVLDLPDPEEEDKKSESTVETSERREGKRKKERKESKEVSTVVYLQCCGTGTTEGTVTFCLSGTGSEMHSVSVAGFGSGSKIKWNKSKKKLK
jgi:hypothetical protein